MKLRAPKSHTNSYILETRFFVTSQMNSWKPPLMLLRKSCDWLKPRSFIEIYQLNLEKRASSMCLDSPTMMATRVFESHRSHIFRTSDKKNYYPNFKYTHLNGCNWLKTDQRGHSVHPTTSWNNIHNAAFIKVQFVKMLRLIWRVNCDHIVNYINNVNL